MKNILTAALLISSATLTLLADEPKQPLIVEAPATWKVELKDHNGIQTYFIQIRKDGDSGLLLLFQWHEPLTVNQIPEKVKDLAEAHLAHAKQTKDFKLTTDKYVIEEINGDTFSGRFAQFEVEGGVIHTTFMIGDADKIWGGVFSGTKERWAEAVTIVKKLKKNS